MECVFCGLLEGGKVLASNEGAFALWDKFPVSKGHALIIPKRHSIDFFGLSERELHACYLLMREVKAVIDEKYGPDAYNIGVNNGKAAGQVIGHCHIHLIPRYVGDGWKGEGIRKVTAVERG